MEYLELYGNMEERIAIRDAARGLKKYGSTSNYHSKRLYDKYIKHEVKQTDTLQGIALKYGVTMEEIRRTNRLWTNDSLFLKQYLLIPVSSGLGGESSKEEEESSDSPRANGSLASSPSSPSSAQLNGASSREDSYSDFLVRIDCSIASTKSSVISAHSNSEFVEDDSLFWRRKTKDRRQSSDSRASSSLSVDGSLSSASAGTPGGSGTSRQSDVIVRTHSGRKVRDSLQRLEKERDEIFEL